MKVAIGSINKVGIRILFSKPSAASLVSKNFDVRASSISLITFCRSRTSITCSATLYKTDPMLVLALWNNIHIMSLPNSPTKVDHSFPINFFTVYFTSRAIISSFLVPCFQYDDFGIQHAVIHELQLSLQRFSLPVPRLTKLHMPILVRLHVYRSWSSHMTARERFAELPWGSSSAEPHQSVMLYRGLIYQLSDFIRSLSSLTCLHRFTFKIRTPM